MALKKLIVKPDDLRKDSFLLGLKIINDNFHPDFMVAIWRGGAPIGCCIHEFLKFKNIQSDHIAIRTSKYTGVDQCNNDVIVHNLGYLTERLNKDSKVLLVDDIFDTGSSIDAIFNTLKDRLKDKFPEDIRVATIFYKPSRNKTDRVPDYYIHETDRWVVFPHELEGLSLEEIKEHLGLDIYNILY